MLFKAYVKIWFLSLGPPKDILGFFCYITKKRHDFKLIRLRVLSLKTYSDKDALRKKRTSIFSLHFYLRIF